MTQPEIQVLRLVGCPIWEQLRIEEALVRADDRNWCVLNSGSSEAIVMGISGKADRLLDLALIESNPIPIIRRFSGGGTVVVDPNTLFATFICRHDALPISPCYPEPIMRWTEDLYRPLFPSGFALRENDYVVGEHKVGGNAQYLRKDRWLHHSTLLWDYSLDRMRYLLLPERRPSYRSDRSHGAFLSRLKDHLPCPEGLLDGIVKQLACYFNPVVFNVLEIEELLQRPHRRATQIERAVIRDLKGEPSTGL